MVRLTVRLTPRGGADRVDGVAPSGELRVRVRPPAAAGAANEALCRLIADELGVPLSAVTLVTGARSRVKQLALDGVSAAELSSRWPGAAAG